MILKLLEHPKYWQETVKGAAVAELGGRGLELR